MLMRIYTTRVYRCNPKNVPPVQLITLLVKFKKAKKNIHSIYWGERPGRSINFGRSQRGRDGGGGGHLLEGGAH